MHPPDRELLQACRQGRHNAWRQLLDKYQRLVYSIPLNYGLSADDADDIAQITFTIFLRSLDSLDDDSRLGAWLATVARRHTWRVIEKRRRESVGKWEDVSERMAYLPDEAGQRPMERWELVEWLHTGYAKLGKRCQQLLQLLYFSDEESSYADAAQELNMPVGSVGPTRARCLEKLKKLLEEE